MMQKSIIAAWLVLMVCAVLVSIVMGICRPFVSAETKGQLKALEVDKGYKSGIMYCGRPAVLIEERYDGGITFAILTMLTLCSWMCVALSHMLPVVTLLYTLVLHVACDVMLARLANIFTSWRVIKMAKIYRSRRAMVVVVPVLKKLAH